MSFTLKIIFYLLVKVKSSITPSHSIGFLFSLCHLIFSFTFIHPSNDKLNVNNGSSRRVDSLYFSGFPLIPIKSLFQSTCLFSPFLYFFLNVGCKEGSLINCLYKSASRLSLLFLPFVYFLALRDYKN